LERIARLGSPNGEETVAGGDGQDRYLDGAGAPPTSTPPEDAAQPKPAPPPPPKLVPVEPSSTPATAPRYPAWLAPQDPAQALRDLAVVQAGGAAMLSDDRKLDLLKHWYVQRQSSITDTDRLAMRELFMTMPVDSGYLAHEEPIRDQILAAIRDDRTIIEGFRTWGTSSREQRLAIMDRIIAHVAGAYRIEVPPIVFNEYLPATSTGAVAARFEQATEVIEVNPTYLDRRPGTLFAAKEMIVSRIVEETVHAYQWTLKKQFGDGAIVESDPRYMFAQQIPLQQPWMYIDPSEEGLFFGDDKGYRAQPTEAHAKMVAQQVVDGLSGQR
jgi:hypothetical protein